MNKQALTSLRDELREATGPSRELDVKIVNAMGGEARYTSTSGYKMRYVPWVYYTMVEGRWYSIPKYTSSLDASIALVEQVLPCAYEINLHIGVEYVGEATITRWPNGIAGESKVSSGFSIPAIALLLALIEALIQEAE